MTEPTHRNIDNASLIDLLDRLIETGVVASGDVLLGLADVDLVRVSLQLVISTVDKLNDDAAPPASAPLTQPATASSGQPAMRTEPATRSQPDAHSQPRMHIRQDAPPPPPLDAADRPDLGVGGLLVAVIEIVHRLLERQAIHRMERGSLTSDQIERLGQALMALDQRINQLIEIFNPQSAPALPVAITGATH